MDRLLYIPKNSDINKHRFILHHNEILQVPTDPLNAMLSPLTRMIPFAVLKDIFKGRRNEKLCDESIEQFFARRFHSDIGDTVMSAFIHGIYGGDVSKWSIRSQFPRMWDLEEKYRSIALGYLLDSKKPSSTLPDDAGAFMQASGFTFRNGMQELTDCLRRYLIKSNFVEIVTSTECKKIEKSGDKIVATLEPFSGKPVTSKEQFDIAYLTIPSFKIGNILGMKQDICDVSFGSLAPVTLCWRKEFRPLKPSLGYLVPLKEKQQYTGVIFDSYAYESRQPKDSTVLTVMFGGPVFEKRLESGQVSPQKLIDEARDIVGSKLGITLEPDLSDVSILRNCMPRYHVGHISNVKKLRTLTHQYFNDSVKISGASFDGIGVPDCIHNSYLLSNNASKLI